MWCLYAQEKMKKAQSASQIFIYILAILIVGVILIFGYQAVMDFTGRANKITLVQFQKTLQSSIESISNQHGTMKTKEFSLTNEYREVCFASNYNTVYSGLPLDSIFQDYPLIQDAIDPQSGPVKNVFLVKSNKEVAESFDIGQTVVGTPTNPFKCFDIQNSMLRIQIEGKGDHVVIS